MNPLPGVVAAGLHRLGDVFLKCRKRVPYSGAYAKMYSPSEPSFPSGMLHGPLAQLVEHRTFNPFPPPLFIPLGLHGVSWSEHVSATSSTGLQGVALTRMSRGCQICAPSPGFNSGAQVFLLAPAGGGRCRRPRWGLTAMWRRCRRFPVVAEEVPRRGEVDPISWTVLGWN